MAYAIFLAGTMNTAVYVVTCTTYRDPRHYGMRLSMPSSMLAHSATLHNCRCQVQMRKLTYLMVGNRNSQQEQIRTSVLQLLSLDRRH